MATARGERMQERMRGAQRHQVADLSFGQLFPGGEDELGEEDAPPRKTPNTSAKRRRLEGEDEPQPPESATRSQRGERSHGRYDIQDADEASVAAGTPARRRPTRGGETPGSASRRSVRNTPGTAMVEEVAESPLDAPGSGQRRRVPVSAAVSQSVLLQQAIGASGGSPAAPSLSASSVRPAKKGRKVSDNVVPSSSTRRLRAVAEADDVDELSPVAVGEAPSTSPATRASLRGASSKATPSVLKTATRNARLSADADEVDELSPAAATEETSAITTSSPLTRRSKKTQPTRMSRPPSTAKRQLRKSPAADDEVDELSPEQPDGSVQQEETPVRQKRKRKRKSQAPAPEEAEEGEAAEEVDDEEAARQIGRKRPRTVRREPSPDLSLMPQSAERVVTQRRKPSKPSPAKQKQGRSQKAKAPAKRRKSGTGDDDGPTGAFSITVQRFKRPPLFQEDDTDADILAAADNPFTGRTGVNVVDVLAEISEAVIKKSCEALRENIRAAEDAPTKRGARAQLRAVESYREGLTARLLEHTIALDSVHALKKRVRAARKEKLALREEMLRLRAEREEVALRMDAVRAKHEAVSQEALHHSKMSAAMHNVDLAVHQGQAAPELTPAEQKKADLANLELLISRITDQACSGSEGGGVLKQIRGFNAFLERAAVMLESR